MKALTDKKAVPTRSCGKCKKTMRMRGDAGTLLCTATLEVVEAGLENVCEHYNERVEQEQLIQRRTLI